MKFKGIKGLRTDKRGFSLGEVLTSITLIGILSAIGIPSFLSFQPGMRLNGAAREVLGRLMWARAQAVQNNNTSTVSFVSNHTFEVFNDSNGNGLADAGETLAVNLQSHYPDVTFVISGSSSTPVFNGRGTASSDTTITLTNSSGSKIVTVSPTGNIRIN